jgi:hypothetical protein
MLSANVQSRGQKESNDVSINRRGARSEMCLGYLIAGAIWDSHKSLVSWLSWSFTNPDLGGDNNRIEL